MRYIYHIYLVLFLLFAFEGCAPVDSSIRYNEKKNTSNGSEEKLRYQETTSPDTLSFSDDEDPEFRNQTKNNNYKIEDAFSSIPQNNAPTNTILTPSLREEFLMAIIMYHNTPYKFGGNDEDGIDCSAFTQNVFKQAGKIQLNRTARDQYTQGIVISDKNTLAFGDLVFFDTRKRVKPGHVGIYIANGLFAHASSKHGVIVSSLEQDYYTRKYMGARRVIAEK